MTSSPLVSTAWLEEHLTDPDLRIIEICSLRDDKTYHEGHIPGAMWVYWKSACWQDSDREFVTPEQMAKLFGSMGIGPDSTVVLYGVPEDNVRVPVKGEPETAGRRAAQMGAGETSIVAERPALCARRLSGTDRNGGDARRPARRS